MNRRRRIWLAGLLLALAALMAFVLQDVIRETVILPLAYFLWMGGVLYRSVSQLVYWIALVSGLTLIAFASLYGRERFSNQRQKPRYAERGAVENFAYWLTQRQRGTYFKWRVANRLGTLGRELLLQRGEEVGGPPFTLTGRGWNPPQDVQAYLEAGLNRSFSEFPRRVWQFRSPVTPFDQDIEPVVAYLESQLETNRDHRHS